MIDNIINSDIVKTLTAPGKEEEFILYLTDIIKDCSETLPVDLQLRIFLFDGKYILIKLLIAIQIAKNIKIPNLITYTNYYIPFTIRNITKKVMDKYYRLS